VPHFPQKQFVWFTKIVCHVTITSGDVLGAPDSKWRITKGKFFVCFICLHFVKMVCYYYNFKYLFKLYVSINLPVNCMHGIIIRHPPFWIGSPKYVPGCNCHVTHYFGRPNKLFVRKMWHSSMLKGWTSFFIKMTRKSRDFVF
jgi:hypothetical protein